MRYCIDRGDALFPFVHCFHLAGSVKADSDLSSALAQFAIELMPTTVPVMADSVEREACLLALDEVATAQWRVDLEADDDDHDDDLEVAWADINRRATGLGIVGLTDEETITNGCWDRVFVERDLRLIESSESVEALVLAVELRALLDRAAAIVL